MVSLFKIAACLALLLNGTSSQNVNPGAYEPSPQQTSCPSLSAPTCWVDSACYETLFVPGCVVGTIARPMLGYKRNGLMNCGDGATLICQNLQKINPFASKNDNAGKDDL